MMIIRLFSKILGFKIKIRKKIRKFRIYVIK